LFVHVLQNIFYSVYVLLSIVCAAYIFFKEVCLYAKCESSLDGMSFEMFYKHREYLKVLMSYKQFAANSDFNVYKNLTPLSFSEQMPNVHRLTWVV